MSAETQKTNTETQKTNTEKISIIDDNSITKEEFMAQFEDESMEIVVETRYGWKKGDRPFPKFGKESLASVHYRVPWLNDFEGPLGEYGRIFWFCKKGLFGYPYKPQFETNKICLYRLRVRPSHIIPSSMPNFRYFYLEEVLEEGVNLLNDDTVYKNAKEKYYADTEEKVTEMTILLKKAIDVSERKFLNPYSVNSYMSPFNAVRFADTGKTKMVEGQLEIPFDERDFSENRNLKIKEGSIIRITARRSTALGMENSYALLKILETDVKDDELKGINEEANKPGKWHIDGLDDFDVKNGEAIGWVQWDPNDEESDVEITLECDVDNSKSAASAGECLSKILADKKAFEDKVYGVMAEDNENEDGMIEIWEVGENRGILTKEEFVKRLRIFDLKISNDGSGTIMIDPDGMFTDHAYVVSMNSDGTFEAEGLIG